MARGPRYSVKFRRRREGKTNYRKRKALILSGKPRLVTRGSLRHMLVQVVEARLEGDHVLASASSKELVTKFGWRGDCGNVPAAYLTGLLAGYRALSKGIKEAVLDIGLHKPSKGSRVFAALKGAVDAGMSIPHGEEILPDMSRIRGEHVAEYSKTLLETNPEKYERQFSGYIRRGFRPEDLPTHFDEVRKKIVSSLGGDVSG